MFSRKQMIKLLAPLIVEQIMAVLVGMVDVVMVAAVGESAVSGVSLVDSISVLIIQIMGALATGGAVISAQYLGKEQPRDARKAAGQLVLVTLLLSVIIAGTALAGGRHLLGGIFGKVEQDVMDNAQTYFWITALSYPFIGLYNACAALFRSMGNSKVSMMTSFVMNMINIIGNAICVFGLKMGVAGVAWPTLISRVTAAFMMFVLIQNRNNTIRLNSWKFLIPDRHMIKNILSIGIPNGLENGMFQFGKIFLQSLVSSLGQQPGDRALSSGKCHRLRTGDHSGPMRWRRPSEGSQERHQIPYYGGLWNPGRIQHSHGHLVRSAGGNLSSVPPGSPYGP